MEGDGSSVLTASRCSVRRRRRAAAGVRELNSAVRCLNEVFDPSWQMSDSQKLSEGRSSSSNAQVDAVRRIQGCVQRMGAPPESMTPAGALRKLCRSGAPVSYQDTPPTLHGRGRKVALPVKGAKPVALVRLLGDAGPREMMEFFQTQRRAKDEALVLQRQRGLQRAYTDPALLRDPQGYDGLLREMFHGGMIELIVRSKSGETFVVRPEDGLEESEREAMGELGSERCRESEEESSGGVFSR